MANIKEKLQTLKTLHSQQQALYAEKNEKYDDAFGKTYAEYGPTVAIIRIEDKLNRVKALVNAGLDESNGESLVDTLTDLANYTNMFLIELGAPPSTPTEKKSPKKRDRKAKKEKPPVKEETGTTREEGPLDDLSKKQLVAIINQLGGTAHPKSNREKLISTINEFPKAKVAVAITSLKSSVETTMEETEDGEGE